MDLESITKAVNADAAALMVPNVAGRYAHCYASYNMPPEWVAIQNSFDEDVSGGNVEVYRTGKPAISNHLQQMLEGHYIESVLIVPVIREGQTVAMLELVHTVVDKVFREEDLVAAEAFAAQLEFDVA